MTIFEFRRMIWMVVGNPLGCGSRRSCLPAHLIVLVIALLGAGCSSGEAFVEEQATATTGYELKPVINLAVNDWTASAINVEIAGQLIERYLGYPVVGVRADDTTDMYQSLVEGDLDAVLEVWPSTVTDRDQRFFDSGKVTSLGELGSIGKVGWFVPSYMVEENPSLATWEGFDDPVVASQLASPSTGGKGRLLGTDPSYLQFDEQIISNLGLPLVVEFSGSEELTRAELERSVAAGRPILAYWWTPTATVADLDLVSVALPPVTDDCLASAASEDGGVACDYPEDRLVKVASPGLETKAPEIHDFLSQFLLTTDDQSELLVAVENDGLSIQAVAEQWIAKNEDRWRTWLEPSSVDDNDDSDG